MTEERPLLTFALFAHNHERFIAEAVRGALSQTYSPLEIIISDDCSVDRTFEIIQEELSAYSGRHDVRLNRNDSNVGLGASINRVMTISKGTLVVIASGDDVSLPDRVEALYESYVASNEKALSIFSEAIVIDEKGNQKGPHLVSVDPGVLTASHMAKRLGGILGASHLWHRRVFEVFGPITEAKGVAEDLIIPFRSALLGEVRFVERPLVLYRLHDDNASFKEPGDIRPHEVEAYLLKHADGLIDACGQRLRDLETMFNLFPNRRDELLGIQRSLLAYLREKQNDKALLTTSSPLKRMLIIWRAVRRGVRIRAIVRWVLVFFFPSIYLSHQRNLRARSTQRGS